MPYNRGRIVIVDDKDEEGLAIARAAWSSGLPALFARFDSAVWSSPDCPYKGQRGVRTLFMDLELLGSSMKANATLIYATVEQAVRTLLAEDNGPYLLVTWTRYDDLAAGLVQHLDDRLPAALRPFRTYHWAKEDLMDAEPLKLGKMLVAALDETPALRTLCDWEGSVQLAASLVAADLGATTRDVDNSGDDPSAVLETLLLILATAEAGKTLDPADVTDPLTSVLSALVRDRVSHALPSKISIGASSTITNSDSWRHRINAMLHYARSTSIHAPGTAYAYPPEDRPVPIPRLSDNKIGKTIRGFFNRKLLSADQKAAVAAESRLILLDVTPPCDHAQRKATWRRYVVGVVLPEIWWDWVWAQHPDSGDVIPGRPWSEHLWISPALRPDVTSPAFRLVVNSRLSTSLPDSDTGALDELQLGRVREQLLADLMGWLGRQATRLGHVSL